MANFDKYLDVERDRDEWIVDCEERVSLLIKELAEARAMLARARRTRDFGDIGDPLLRDPSPGVDPRMFDLGTDTSPERP